MYEALVLWISTFDVPIGPSPWAMRILVGGLAAWLVGRGGALERDGVRLAGALCGVLAAIGWMHEGGQMARMYEPFTWCGSAAIGAALMLWLDHLQFRIGLAVSGLVAGAVWGMAVAVAFHADDQTGWVTAFAVVCAGAMPWVFEAFPRWLSPFVAAAPLAWAVGWSDQLPALVAIWALGIAAQWFTGPTNVVLDSKAPTVYGRNRS